MSVIELKDVSVTFHEGGRTVEAVKHVTLNVDKGEIFGIVGFSGAGKSTLVRTINLLERPTGGQVVIDGNDITGLRGADLRGLRKKIGFIFQGFNLIPALTALENVELPLIYRGLGREERHQLAVDALTSVGLEKRMSHRPGEMSGGQQQRVAIARAVAAKPPIIMADEPTGNLDSASGLDIMRKLTALNEQGTSIILITHDNHLAQMAKRIVTIQDGRIISDTKGGAV